MKNIPKLSACVVFVVVWLACLWLLPTSPLTVAFSIPVCMGLATVLHETGHLLTYRLLGLEWTRMHFFCLVFQPGKVYFSPEGKLFSAGCTCAYDPALPLWRYTLALLSGGLTTLLAAIVAFCFASGPVLLCFASLCAANALFNLLNPFSADRVLLKQIQQERENAA
jgi:hypothetical protein